MATRGKSAKEKGKRYERRVGQLLTDIWPDARRNLDKATDNRGQDLTNTGSYIIQCKNHDTYVPMRTIMEMDLDWVDSLGMVPVMVTKASGKIYPDIVVMRTRDLDELTHNVDIYRSRSIRSRRQPLNKVLELQGVWEESGRIPILVTAPHGEVSLSALLLTHWMEIIKNHNQTRDVWSKLVDVWLN